jgi:GNAT superfamily N-acetyltransferase
MSMNRMSYQIRKAHQQDVPRLREIEDAAGTLFSGLGLIDETRDPSFPRAEAERLVALGQGWVACADDGTAVGAVLASVREGAAYIEEIDVLPEHGRRGVGARLLSTVADWARSQGYAAVTSSRRESSCTVELAPLRSRSGA